ARYAAAASPSVPFFFLISRLSLRQRSESSSSFAFSKKASRPPRCSTDFSARAQTRRRKLRPRISLISVTLHRFGRNLRFVLFSAWLRSCPERGSLPVSSHCLVIVKSSFSAAAARQSEARKRICLCDFAKFLSP